jgi:uncharacterized OB-fold protein
MARLLGDAWVLPALDDLNRPWFTSGKVQVQACDDCGAFQQPPDEICGSCQGTRLSFRECSGEGTIESVAVVHQAVHPALKDAVPYAVVVVSVDGAPGVNAIGNVVNRPPSEVRIGQRVRVAFEECTSPEEGEALKIPMWEVV